MDVLQKSFANLIFHKDLGMRIIKGTSISPDDYAIGRDLALAQFIPHFYWEDTFNRLVVDRGYWSSYVYGQCWRDRYDKNFWTEHLKKVEGCYGAFLKQLKIVLFRLTEEDFDRIENMNRQKDDWEGINDYRKQYDLYKECIERSKARVYSLEAFKSEDYIVQTFSKVFND